MTQPGKIGLIINPLAGIGGAVGLKGSDGIAVQEKARQLGAQPRAMQRTLTVLKSLAGAGIPVEIYCYAGEMGADVVVAAGLEPVLIGTPGSPTTAADTRLAARTLVEQGIELIVFAGGDGTARDIAESVHPDTAVIGIPAGVKMYSAVFANSPATAGKLLINYLHGTAGTMTAAEVMDIDEGAFRKGVVSPKLYGYLKVPNLPAMIQGPKAPTRGEQESQNAIARNVIEQMDSGTCYIIGPGTTTRAIMDLLHLESTLTGIDVVKDKTLVRLDVDERLLLEIAEEGRCKIIVTPIGGQGHLFGRGNLPISDEVIRRAGVSNIIVIATPGKLASLHGEPLKIDLNNKQIETLFPKYLKIITGYNEKTIYPIAVEQ